MTKEYLKMADFVKHGVTVTPHGFVAGVNYEAASGELIVRDVYAALSHAINSHDELVAEVERLRELIGDAFVLGGKVGIELSSDGNNANPSAEIDQLRSQIKNAFIDGCLSGWDMSGDGFNAEYCTMSDDNI